MYSMRLLTELMNALASAPSMMRWSKLMQRFIMERMDMPSPMTTGTADDGLCRQDCGLWEVYERLAEDRSESAGVVEGECAALHVVQGERAAPGSVGDVGDPAGESGYTQGIGVMHDRNDEAVASGGGYANVDPALVDDRVVVPGGVEERVLFEGLSDRLRYEWQIGDVDALAQLEVVTDGATPGNESADIHFDERPGLWNLSRTPDHVFGDHAADGGEGNALVVVRYGQWLDRRGRWSGGLGWHRRFGLGL